MKHFIIIRYLYLVNNNGAFFINNKKVSLMKKRRRPILKINDSLHLYIYATYYTKYNMIYNPKVI